MGVRLDSWPTNMGESVGGLFEEREVVKEDRLETLRARPGEAARRAVAAAENGPAPSRWVVRTIRASVEWLTGDTVSGVWRGQQACGLGLNASCARLFSPDPDCRRKVRRLHCGLRAAARHPETVAALFLDEFGYPRRPEVAPTWGLKSAVAQRADNNQQWCTIGALNALTGQVNYRDGYIVGSQQVIQCYSPLDHASTAADRLYVIQDNWNIHPHPDVLTALERYPDPGASGV